MPDPNQNDQNLNPAGETLDESGASMSPTEDASDGTAIGSDALEAARNEAAQSRDALLRALADSENIRRRAQTDLANAHKYAIENFATMRSRARNMTLPCDLELSWVRMRGEYCSKISRRCAGRL